MHEEEWESGTMGWMVALVGCALFSLRKVPVELNSRLADLCRRCFLFNPSHQPSAYPCQLTRYVTETGGINAVFCRTGSIALLQNFVLYLRCFFPSSLHTGKTGSARHFHAAGRQPCLEGEFKRRCLFFEGRTGLLSCSLPKSVRRNTELPTWKHCLPKCDIFLGKTIFVRRVDGR